MGAATIRIRVINPDGGLTRDDLAFRERRLSKAAHPDTQISIVCPAKNEIPVDSMLDVAPDSGGILEMALAAERDAFDAVCLYCFNDPAIDACRERLTIPVVGGGQASILVAAMLGRSFSILTTSPRRVSQKRAFVRSTGVDASRLASVRAVPLPPGERRGVTLAAALAEQAKRCADDDGADVVVLGCMDFAGMAPEASARAGVPVVDPALVLVNMAELLVNQKLSHSKAARLFPPEREWWRDSGFPAAKTG